MIGENTVLGEKTVVGERTVIQNSVIGSNCVIGANVRIYGSYIWNDVKIGNGAVLTSAVVCDNVLVKEKAVVEPGAVLSFKVRPASRIFHFERAITAKLDLSERVKGNRNSRADASKPFSYSRLNRRSVFPLEHFHSSICLSLQQGVLRGPPEVRIFLPSVCQRVGR